MEIVKEYRIIEDYVADDLLLKIKELPDAYWIDRSKYSKNIGLNGETGEYLSLGQRAMPKDLKDELYSVAPKKDFPLTDVIINKYGIGDYMPRHLDDAGGAAHCVILHLEDSEKGKGLSTDYGVIEDKKGWVKDFQLNFEHWVEPLEKERFVVIYVYNRVF